MIGPSFHHLGGVAVSLFSALRNWLFPGPTKRLARFVEHESSRIQALREYSRPAIELFRDACGVIRHVRIGDWRVIAATGSRSIGEVRVLEGCNRIAVRIESQAGTLLQPSCTIWELYDREGVLQAMLQSTGERDHWLTTDFSSRRILPRRRPARIERETVLEAS